jgi:hypothetical protein
MKVQVPDLPSPIPARDANPDSDEAFKGALSRLRAKNEVSVRITYRADRTGVIESSPGGEERTVAFSWGLLSATPEQIKIDQETSDPPSLERITYQIDSPDKMTIMDGVMKGKSVTRVK